ncbi:MAG: NADPH-dependent FMN reductase [Haliea sp.]|nr:NADPH-dependent FMN reductase [Haliea sp.]MAM71865.1 NADPH-dependent FMN reductase [Gammaproteobacteria bacterium]|tara:strand:- start:2909 stop:3445 length:537 start_codon:yes stop_codon:yes gene_type:complete
MKILSFPASNSSQSINRKLLSYAERFLPEFDIEHLDINDYEMPIYSMDREHASGIPEQAKAFVASIAGADALLISFAEHNGNYTAAFKNILDWCSRFERNIYQHKKMLLLSTSPGQGGGSTVLKMAESAAPFFGGKVITTLSIPGFNENFDTEKGELTHKELDQKLIEALGKFKSSLE